jgi:hypothetical protein
VNASYNVLNDGYDIGNDNVSLGLAVDRVTGAAAELSKHVAAYQQMAAQQTVTVPPGAPDVGSVSATIGRADRLAAAWKESGRAYQRQADALTERARHDAQAAQERYC